LLLLINSRDLIRTVATLLLAASLLHSPVVLASKQSQASLRKGAEALQAGEFQKALDYFVDAEKLGATEVSLYYNMGVAHYKLGQYQAADEAFLKVARYPKWEPLAQYNRALIAYQRNQPELAKRLATISIRLSQSPGLTALNYRLLDKLENKNPEKPGWSRLMLFGFGYNDNVVLADVGPTAISGKGDAFLDFTGRAQRAFTLQNSKKLKWSMQASVRDYARLNEYDQIGLRTGFEKQLARPNSALGAHLEHVSLDGKGYELVTSLEYRRTFTREKNNPPVFTYRFYNYSMLNNDFAYLGGVRHRFQLEKENKLAKGSVKAYLRAEYNDREDQILSGDFYSYSPVRAGLGTIFTRNLSRQQLLSGSLYLQQSRYKDADSRGGVFKTREDGLLELRLSLIHVSPGKWIYRANYIHTDNSSNYSEFSYNQNIVSFEMFKTF